MRTDAVQTHRCAPLATQVARCARITDLSALSSCTALRTLKLFGCVAIDSVKPLQHLKQLKFLDLGMVLGQHPLDLSPLEACVELEVGPACLPACLPPYLHACMRVACRQC
jgi:hypothetical protein